MIDGQQSLAGKRTALIHRGCAQARTARSYLLVRLEELEVTRDAWEPAPCALSVHPRGRADGEKGNSLGSNSDSRNG